MVFPLLENQKFDRRTKPLPVSLPVGATLLSPTAPDLRFKALPCKHTVRNWPNLQTVGFQADLQRGPGKQPAIHEAKKPQKMKPPLMP